LAIYRDLIEVGHKGSPVGEIRKKLNIPASTLSHHIAKLVHAGLITQERDSRTLYCKADFTNMDALMTFLVKNCCAEDSCIQVRN
jgi:DNA-binding transcriptional ArsR family regulator